MGELRVHAVRLPGGEAGGRGGEGARGGRQEEDLCQAVAALGKAWLVLKIRVCHLPFPLLI